METTKLTKVAIWSLYLNMLCTTVSAISSYLQYDLLVGFTEGRFNESIIVQISETNDNREQIIGVITLVSYFICVVVIGRWIFVSSKITHLSGADNLTISPGWSVGWYFVPILSLWKPYQAFKQIYQVSIQIVDWRNVSVPVSLKWWWGLWIFNSLVGQIQFRVSMGDSSIETLKLVSLSYVLMLPVVLLLNYIFLNILKTISQKHNSHDFQRNLT